MIKKFTLLLLAMLCIAGTSNADALKRYNLWEGSQVGYGEITIANTAFTEIPIANDFIRINLTSTGTGSLHVTKSNGSAFTDIPEWPYCTSSTVIIDLPITSNDLDELKTNGLKVYGFDPHESLTGTSTITSIEHIQSSLTEIWADATGVSLENWNVLDNTDLKNAAKAALLGDVFRVSIKDATIHSGNTSVSLSIANPDGWGDFYSTSPKEEASEKAYDFKIVDADKLELIQRNGILVKGCDLTVTKVELITYADSYDAVSVTIGSYGIATWSSSKKLDFSGKGITPYYASGVAKGTVTLTAISDNTTWDHQGYILKGAPGTYDIPVTETATYPSTTNYLIATSDYSGKVQRSEEGAYHYIFAKDAENEIGFYKIAEDYSRVTTEEEFGNAIGTTVYYHRLAAHKAYLATTTNFSPDPSPSTPAPALNLIFGGEGEGTTAINTVSKNPIVEDGIYYNLQGVAVKNPSKGLYILNGKKVIVK